MKNNRGITLIALVITIIVLLILVGVTLAMISGESSIFTKAATASEETFIAQAKELAGVVVSESMTDYYDAKYVNKSKDVTDLLSYLETDIASKSAEYSDWMTFETDTFKVKGYEDKVSGKLDENGHITWKDTRGTE